MNEVCSFKEVAPLFKIRDIAKIVKLLISHPSVDPTAPINEPIFVANNLLHTAVVDVLLRDGRAPIDAIYQVPRPQQMINPSYVKRIRNIPQIALEVCISGNLDLAQSLKLEFLDEYHLNLLYERARSWPLIQKIIRSWQLKLLGAPEDQQTNACLLSFLAQFGNVSLEQLKKLARPRAVWMRVSKIPAEIAAEVASYEPSDSIKIMTVEIVPSPIRRYMRTISYNNPTLYFFCLFMLNRFIVGLEGIEGFRTVMQLLILWALINDYYYGKYAFNNFVPENDAENVFLLIRQLATKFVIGMAVASMFHI